MLLAKELRWGQHHRHCQNSCTDHICHNDSGSQKYLHKIHWGAKARRHAAPCSAMQHDTATASPGHAVVAKQLLQIAILWLNPRNSLSLEHFNDLSNFSINLSPCKIKYTKIYHIVPVSPSHYSKIGCSWILRSTWLPWKDMKRRSSTFECGRTFHCIHWHAK